MAVRAEDIRRGEYFVAANQELGQEIRKVTQVAADGPRIRVHFQSKSASATRQPFLFAHSPDNAPVIEDFALQCERRLGFLEIQRLRLDGVLLPYE